MPDWNSLSERKPLDPYKPEEYLEAIRRFVNIGIDQWDNLPDGDGNINTEGGIATKTDIFSVICGAAGFALDNIKIANEINCIQ